MACVEQVFGAGHEALEQHTPRPMFALAERRSRAPSKSTPRHRQFDTPTSRRPCAHGSVQPSGPQRRTRDQCQLESRSVNGRRSHDQYKELEFAFQNGTGGLV
jgi:hypothetical protein